MTEELLTDLEVAALLKVGHSTVINMRWQRRGPPWLKVGGSVRYRRSDLDEYLAAQATRQPVHPGVSEDDIRAAVAAVHGFGEDREGAAKEIKRWLVAEVGVKLKVPPRGEHSIRIGRIANREGEATA